MDPVDRETADYQFLSFLAKEQKQGTKLIGLSEEDKEKIKNIVDNK